MEDDLFTVLHTTCSTVDDAYHRLRLLRRFLENIYFAQSAKTTPASLTTFLEAAGMPPAAIKALEAWGNQWIPTLTADTFYALFENIRPKIAHIPTITLVVPVMLPLEEREAVGGWLRAHVDSSAASGGLLIDLLVDERAVGGCRIVHRGRYGDFSFRYFIEQSRPELTKALAGVAV